MIELDINDLNSFDIPNNGIACILHGKYYHRLGYGEVCFLSSKSRLNPEFILPIDVARKIQENDQLFGSMVGGIFAYADYTAEVTGMLIKTRDNVFVFSKLYSIKLTDLMDTQIFPLNLNYSYRVPRNNSNMA